MISEDDIIAILKYIQFNYEAINYTRQLLNP